MNLGLRNKYKNHIFIIFQAMYFVISKYLYKKLKYFIFYIFINI